MDMKEKPTPRFSLQDSQKVAAHLEPQWLLAGFECALD